MFMPVLWQLYLWSTQKKSKVKKKDDKCRKKSFKAGKHALARILATVYPIDAKKAQSAKKRTANATKPVSKPANTFSLVSWKLYLQLTQKLLQCAKKLTANALKLVSKLASTRFHLFLGNNTSNQHKNTSKVLKKERQIPYNKFQTWRTHIFTYILATVPSIDTKIT